MRGPRLLNLLLVSAVIATGGLVIREQALRHPERLPWTALDLDARVGPFTGRKLAALGDARDQCLSLLRDAKVRFTPLPPVEDGACGYRDAVTIENGGANGIDWRPADVGAACPVAAALAVWQREVVQPAARRHLGAQVAVISHYGTYSCRRMYGREGGDWSEHATADAIDIAGFELTDGRAVTVRHDWRGDAAEAAFLRDVRDGACRLFATVLSPDYNKAHADHLHLDQASRGATGWRACR